MDTDTVFAPNIVNRMIRAGCPSFIQIDYTLHDDEWYYRSNPADVRKLPAKTCTQVRMAE